MHVWLVLLDGSCASLVRPSCLLACFILSFAPCSLCPLFPFAFSASCLRLSSLPFVRSFLYPPHPRTTCTCTSIIRRPYGRTPLPRLPLHLFLAPRFSLRSTLLAHTYTRTFHTYIPCPKRPSAFTPSFRSSVRSLYTLRSQFPIASASFFLFCFLYTVFSFDLILALAWLDFGERSGPGRVVIVIVIVV